MEGLLNYEQAANYLGVAEITLKKWVQDKRISHVRFSKKCTRFKVEDLEKFANSARVEAA